MVSFSKTEAWLITNFSVLRIFEQSERSKISKKKSKLLSFSENFGRFLSLRMGVVPIISKNLNYRVFSENFFISKIDQSLGLIWHFPQKKVFPKEKSSTLFFSGKIKKMQVFFSMIVFLHWCLSYCCCRNIFCIQNSSQSDEFVSNFVLHRRLTTESTNTCSSPGNLENFADKSIKFLQRTIKPPRNCENLMKET